MEKVVIFLKKWWKYLLAVLPAVIILIVVAIRFFQNPKVAMGDLAGKMGTIKDNLQAATLEAKVAATAATTKDEATKAELKKVLAVEDKSERLKQLAEMAKRG